MTKTGWMTARVTILALVAGAAGSACGGPAAAPPSFGDVDEDAEESAAIGKIAYARLARDLACAAPHEGAPEVESRFTLARNSTVMDLAATPCKSGVHPRELGDCLAKIRALPCSVHLDHVTSIEPCNVKPLCGVPADEGTL